VSAAGTERPLHVGLADRARGRLDTHAGQTAAVRVEHEALTSADSGCAAGAVAGSGAAAGSGPASGVRVAGSTGVVSGSSTYQAPTPSTDTAMAVTISLAFTTTAPMAAGVVAVRLPHGRSMSGKGAASHARPSPP
jgi:hypothetical protein